MSEAIIEKTEQVEAVAEKPYSFRQLCAPDIFLMSSIISKIGIKEFKAIFEAGGVMNLIAGKFAEEKSADENADIISVGAGVFLELASIVLKNLPKCENEIYCLLAQTSNLSVEEIKADGNAVMFFEMLVDFIKKEEFADFIKVVSRLF